MSIPLEATGGDDRTPGTRATDAHFSRAHMCRDTLSTHTRWPKNVFGVLVSVRHQKSFVRLLFRRALLGVPDPFPSFPATPPPTQPSLLQTGMSANTCADPRGGLLFGRMAEQCPLAATNGTVVVVRKRTI